MSFRNFIAQSRQKHAVVVNSNEATLSHKRLPVGRNDVLINCDVNQVIEWIVHKSLILYIQNLCWCTLSIFSTSITCRMMSHSQMVHIKLLPIRNSSWCTFSTNRNLNDLLSAFKASQTNNKTFSVIVKCCTESCTQLPFPSWVRWAYFNEIIVKNMRKEPNLQTSFYIYMNTLIPFFLQS